ncbi:MAG TPA: class I SAM-dependent methyltransferase [Brevundimonas sp.]
MTGPLPATPEADDALLGLLEWLEAAGYAFVNPTPSTHALVRERCDARKEDLLRDVFGWVRPFDRAQMPDRLLALMETAGLLVDTEGKLASALRVSRLEGRLFLHSAPTCDNDAVFLGPDSYRFARLLRQVLTHGPAIGHALDIGTGAGVGAVMVKDLAPDAEVHASDINPSALRLAGLNARHAGLNVLTRLGSGLPGTPASFDLIIANPPYIAGDVGKTYRDGGDDYGAALALEWVREGVRRLAPGGRFILYSGAAVVAGRDVVLESLTALCAHAGLSLDYDELDPDVFGQTLRQNAYRNVDRIAAVGAVITAPSSRGG